ncbi:TonB-dependent siderophore receptor [Variovorax dokdonensis]|uniref:TonB-dependent siderophore receptor n=1 Tax=Variovorax dokdonensis TaxID=344883 RepID=A0ABT7N7G1_9BURK|nr:TonB-dependent siderophore receptor [Variovorax dokdonensis]
MTSSATEGTGAYVTRQTSTATPLNLSPRETPQSMSVVTQQQIADQGMRTISDVVKNSTGMAVNQYETNRGSFISRGFELNTLMIDGVPTTWEQPWSSGEIFTSLAMYDHVELVRGATGLTSGAGEPSGAINLVRKRANATQFQGNLELEAGSWNQKRALIDLNTPVNEAKTLRARIVGEFQDKDSWTDNLSSKSQTLFATIEADLTPDTLLTAGLSYQKNKAKGPMWGGLPVFYADGSFTDWDTSKTAAADWTNWTTSYQTYFASLEQRLGTDWKLKLDYTRGERKADSYLLYAFGAPDATTGLGVFTFPGSYDVKTTQDDFAIRASGSFEALGRKHELGFGYVASRQEFLANARTATPAGGMLPNFNTWDGFGYAQPAWSAESYYGDGTTRQDALYGAARLHLADPLKVILGMRANYYKRDGGDIYSNPYSLKYDNEITPFVGLTYDITPQLSAYASYTNIFLPQVARDINGNYIEPIKGNSGEVGMKAEFLDRRLNASAALFQIKQKNLAIATTDQLVGIGGLPETAYRAADGATSKGFEMELTGQLATGWNLTAGYSQYTLEDEDGTDVNTIYPRKLLRVFTTYRLPGALSGLTLGGGVSWQSKTYTTAINPLGVPTDIEQGAYSLVNLMARYDFSPQLSLQLNINNVTDKKYYGMFDAYDQITYAEPRSATLTMNYRF